MHRDVEELRTKFRNVRRSWSAEATWILTFACVTFSFGDLLFGIDTGSFGSIQALPSFLRKFAPSNAKGAHSFDTHTISVMNSIVWPGKFVGSLVFEPLADRVGYKTTMYLCIAIQCVAVIVQMTANTWQVYNGGRIIAYFAVGIIQNTVPSYQAECAPAGLRGFFAGFMHMMTGMGNLVGSGVGRAYATEQGPKGYLICTGIQFVPAILLVILVPFCPQSPRWLVMKGRHDEAIKALERLRPDSHKQNGMVLAEVEALEVAVEESNTTQRGGWSELLHGQWPRRVFIGSWSFFYNQAGGNQLVNLYGPTFLKSIGYGTLAFTYTNVITAVGLVAALIALLVVDVVGRRRVAITGMTMAAIAAAVVGGVGSKSKPQVSDLNTIVAALVFVSSGNKLCFQPLCYIIAAELGGVRMRRKCLAIGTMFDVVMAFVVSYSVPYILDDLGAKIGFVFMGVCVSGVLYSILLLPELTGRSLEEVDEMFQQKPRLHAWQFRHFETHGIGRRIAELEMNQPGDVKIQDQPQGDGHQVKGDLCEDDGV